LGLPVVVLVEVAEEEDEEDEEDEVVEEPEEVEEAGAEQLLQLVWKTVVLGPDVGTVCVLGKYTMNPTLTSFPTGRVPWYEVTVYWLPDPA